MSTEIQDKNGISITRFFAGEEHGVAFQVTWVGSEHIHNWVHFTSQEDAEAFAALLEKRLIR